MVRAVIDASVGVVTILRTAPDRWGPVAGPIAQAVKQQLNRKVR
jgi:hypothetical protein